MSALSGRALNRALLARQSLLSRQAGPAIEMIEHLVGMQAQAPFPPYYGLWTRLRGFEPGELSRLLLDREVVRIVVMRGTVHLVSAADATLLRPLTQPIMDRDLRGNTTNSPKLAGMDLDEVAEAARALLTERPRGNTEFARLLGERWPERDPKALVYAARNLLPLVQVPPRAVWGRSGRPTYATVEDWLGRPLGQPDPERMILRYLAAFGPATVQDVQTWCGLTRLGELVERLRPRLRTFRSKQGRELFDLPDAPRPDPDIPAPARFLPEYDNLLLSHADRTRVIDDADRRRMTTPNGIQPAVILVDGVVSGRWRIDRSGNRAMLEITPFGKLSRKDISALTAEGGRLLRFAELPDGEIRFTTGS
ncbi:winged helix DNA-binding domain-containing protein [Qaidamihabitans albus]|uniref:winged helix DNA-binding domain-containing protein n=1 Tax=Qaidamihabitans albus TaxID=2795733 RepID=UPI0018F1AB0B|nr:winged helix DNA-binding domain-containing protein [Qaidamihabitans albus]